VGAVIEKPDVYKYLIRIREPESVCRLSGMKPSRQELMEQLERVGLAHRAKDRVKTFSQGMKQSVGYRHRMVHDPNSSYSMNLPMAWIRRVSQISGT
jgi:ABC-type multidrug transport system ATPase subunit